VTLYPRLMPVRAELYTCRMNPYSSHGRGSVNFSVSAGGAGAITVEYDTGHARSQRGAPPRTTNAPAHQAGRTRRARRRQAPTRGARERAICARAVREERRGDLVRRAVRIGELDVRRLDARPIFVRHEPGYGPADVVDVRHGAHECANESLEATYVLSWRASAHAAERRTLRGTT
jgi:hypothetical protein